ncbi:cytochrome C [Sedimentimonas flavescens]|uniref:Cytochrome C n=1 Tax=Sedimentimonas flavescens TaxID=2851012 RepID=A0ABT3A0V1_9RHOB|nr:cytochrome C [Sedimentimonas flavescens]MBW0156504.1 cytochrome C [Sedimentimonas flavescens]MCT2538995.1 cytochrome C [Sedimentimonas flavescens]MCV2879561.1 cytochrome C [Sedimentimonas flavescens]WBL32272.1 cytochrome C [Sinirhodobacter sp. HNIBRBA609]
MKISLYATLAAMALATPSFAGDAAVGEKTFAKCKSCHMIVAPDGTEIVKGGKVGPNLYGIVGRAAASVEGFKYGDGLTKAAENGLVWDEALIAEYVVDPTKFIDTHGGEGKSKMTFKLAKGGEDVAAYLASVAQ